MPTIKKLYDDLVLMMNQSDPSDDFPLDIRQVKFWITSDVNAFIATEINSKLKLGEMVPSIYQVIEKCVVPELEESECDDGCTTLIKLELSQDVMTLNNDGGVIMVVTEDGYQVLKAGDISNLMLFNNMKFTKPKNDRLIYYRSGTTLFVAGVSDPSQLPFDKFTVYYVPKYDYDSAANDTEVIVSDLVLPLLQNSIYQRAKVEIYGSTPDQANDGTDVKQVLYHSAISNPNSEPQAE